MNKELEEAKEILYKYINFNEICGTRNFKNAIETLIQAVENSIATSVIYELIKEYKNLIQECINDEEHCNEIPLYEHDIKVLQELLQRKGEK